MIKVNITRVKQLTFRRPDAEFVDIKVPTHWNQSLVRKIVYSEYTVHLLETDRIPAEAEYCKISIGSGPTCGFVIPGSAILSPENPNSDDALYCAYNLLIADAVCRASTFGRYELASERVDSASSRNNIFHQDVFYLIVWNRHLSSPQNFTKDFSVSLCAHGLVFPASDVLPTELISSAPGDGSTLKLKATSNLPEYVITILASLVPYCRNPFLRFFYLYQVVEYLMGEEFDSRVADVRPRLADNKNLSKVELREILEKFQDATKEKARIKKVLHPDCPNTSISANALLEELGISDRGVTFAERLYRIRNILFHDYGVLHSQGEAISSICQGLYAYLVEKKILT